MDTPKDYLAIYVGEQEKERFVVPVSLLTQPSFQELLRQLEEEFGDIPKGYLAIYVGKQDKKRFVAPVSLLIQPSFQGLVYQSGGEFIGYKQPMAGLTILCSEDIFTNVAYRLGAS